MTLSEKFLMSVVKTEENQMQETASMLIVIKHPYAYLQQEMEAMFEKRDNVKVLLDRRKTCRNTRFVPVIQERRKMGCMENRKEMVKVICNIQN